MINITNLTNVQSSIDCGVQLIFTFKRYQASVVKSKYSYGGDENLWELAVLKNGVIVYNTPVTSDVEGYLTDEDVNDLLKKIEQL